MMAEVRMKVKKKCKFISSLSCLWLFLWDRDCDVHKYTVREREKDIIVRFGSFADGPIHRHTAGLLNN